jgi:endonuclease/exonuclease/phosphatase (EEP) superfamily protein YafD
MASSGLKKRKLIYVILAMVLVSWGVFDYIFDVPPVPEVVLLKSASDIGAMPDVIVSRTCSQLTDGSSPVDEQGNLNVLVWNIYKENRSEWSQALNQFSQDKQLVLLQESSLSPNFQSWLKDNPRWQAVQAHAFSLFGQGMGVMNLSGYLPLSSCAYLEMEPWIRLPKSALISYYPLSDQQTLAVVNIHAVNFTLGIRDYQEQLDELAEKIQSHTGPVIFAGDFNSWSEERMNYLHQMMSGISMTEVVYSSPDRRKQYDGYPLDHLFYRGLTLNQAGVEETSASDHNPIQVSFSLASDQY